MHSFVVRLTFAGPAINENPDRSNDRGFPLLRSALYSNNLSIQFSNTLPQPALNKKNAFSNAGQHLAEVVDRILDKGIVIDAWAKVSLVGIELLSVEARVVIASVETYLKYAEAIGLTASAAAPA